MNFLLKGLLKICSTFTGEHPCQIVLHAFQSCFKPLSILLFTQLFCSNIYVSSKSERVDLMKTAQLFYFHFIPNYLKAFKIINWKLWEQVLWITLICVMIRNLLIIMATHCILLKKSMFELELHCVKCVQIRSFIWSECGKIRTTKNSVFGHFSRSAILTIPVLDVW